MTLSNAYLITESDNVEDLELAIAKPSELNEMFDDEEDEWDDDDDDDD